MHFSLLFLGLCQEKIQTPTPQTAVQVIRAHPKFLGLHSVFQALGKVLFISAVTKMQFCDFSQYVSLYFAEKQSICNFLPNPWHFWTDRSPGSILWKSRKVRNHTLNPWLERNTQLLLPSGILSPSWTQLPSYLSLAVLQLPPDPLVF